MHDPCVLCISVGIMNRDYETNAAHVHPSVINHWTGTGLAMSIAANRVSYVFNFTGPSLSLDSACSSSLVALHLASQSIKQGLSSIDNFRLISNRGNHSVVSYLFRKRRLISWDDMVCFYLIRGLWNGCLWRGQLHPWAKSFCCAEQSQDDLTWWNQQTFFQ